MGLHVLDGDWTHLLGHQTSQSFVDCHAKTADALAAQAERGREYEVGAIRFEQVRRAHVRPEAFGNQCHNVHQRLGRLATVAGEVCDFFQREHVLRVPGTLRVGCTFCYFMLWIQCRTRASV